jgi:branched-chain amino acid transport system permease protein
MQELVQQLIIGLSIGATYALIALGYTMVYGVLRLINFAHGEVYMAGGVFGWFLARVVTHAELPPWTNGFIVILVTALAAVLLFRFLRDGSVGFLVLRIALTAVVAVLAYLLAPAIHVLLQKLANQSMKLPSWGKLCVVFGGAMVFCATLGVTIEFFAYRPLRTRPRLVVLITAIGVSLLLQNLAQSPKIFGPTPRSMDLSLFEPRTVISFSMGDPNNPVLISNLDVLGLSLSLVLMAALTWIVLRTKIGLALRAVSWRVDTAALMGVNTDRTIMFTFILGSSLAAVAGVMDAIRYNVKPLMGLMPGLKAFIAAVLGGIGSIPGALLGALILGLVETMARYYLPRDFKEFADAVAFIALILILLFKPSGLLGSTAREKV